LGRGPTIGSPWNSSTPPSLGRHRVALPPPKARDWYTGSERNWTARGRRVSRFAYGDDGSRFSTEGKGVRGLRPVKDGEDVAGLKNRDM